MKTITIAEFLINPTDYLAMAKKNAIVVATDDISIQLSPVDDVLIKYSAELAKCIKQAREGKTKTIGNGSIEDLVKYMKK